MILSWLVLANIPTCMFWFLIQYSSYAFREFLVAHKYLHKKNLYLVKMSSFRFINICVCVYKYAKSQSIKKPPADARSWSKCTPHIQPLFLDQHSQRFLKILWLIHFSINIAINMNMFPEGGWPSMGFPFHE